MSRRRPPSAAAVAVIAAAAVVLLLASPAFAVAPTKMAAPVVKVACSTTLTVVWSEAAHLPTSYTLEKSTSKDSGYASVYTGAALEKVVDSLTAGSTYYFRVKATNGDGTSPVSEVLTATTLAAVKPVRMAKPLVSDVCADKMTLEWVAPEGCPTQYQLNIDNGANTQTVTFPDDNDHKYVGSALTHSFGSLTSSRTYKLKIVATNAHGTSDESDLLYQSTVASTDVPTKLAAPLLQEWSVAPARTHTDVTAGSMTIRWNKGDRCTSEYTLEMDGYDDYGTASWNKVRDAAITHAQVTRDSDTKVTITIPQISSYAISTNEAIDVRLPASVVQSGDADLLASSTFPILATASTEAAALSGTMITTVPSKTDIASTTTYTVTVTLLNTQWEADVASDATKKANLIKGLVSACSCGDKGWNTLRDAAGITVVRDSHTKVTLTIPQMSTYAPTADERVALTIPASVITGSSDIVAGNKILIVKDAASRGLGVSGTFVDTPRTADDVKSSTTFTIELLLRNDKWVSSVGADVQTTKDLVAAVDAGVWVTKYTGSALTYEQGGLDSSKSYRWRVTPKNAAGKGKTSDPLFQKFPKLYLLVSDFKNHAVVRFDGVTGAFVDEFVTRGSGGLKKPWGLALGHDGDLLVASEGTSSILKYSIAKGEYVKKFASVPGQPRGLMVGPANNWPTNLMPHETAEWRKTCPDIGKGKGEVHWPGFGANSYSCPKGRIDVNMVENKRAFMPACCLSHLYVTSHFADSVLKYKMETGAPLGTFAAGVDSPFDLRLSPIDGHVYVASEQGDKVVQVNGVTGAVMADGWNQGKRVNYATTLDFKVDSTDSSKGQAYVTGPYAGKAIPVFDGKSGSYSKYFSDSGLRYALSMVAVNGSLFVTDKDRVVQYDADTGELKGTFASRSGMIGTGLLFYYG